MAIKMVSRYLTPRYIDTPNIIRLSRHKCDISSQQYLSAVFYSREATNYIYFFLSYTIDSAVLMVLSIKRATNSRFDSHCVPFAGHSIWHPFALYVCVCVFGLDYEYVALMFTCEGTLYVQHGFRFWIKKQVLLFSKEMNYSVVREVSRLYWMTIEEYLCTSVLFVQ